nr:integrase, catalytic region, zinc finger, CCHC-type, peptidase aspartic, catalytic [Tanacetum cinerariifolium]
MNTNPRVSTSTGVNHNTNVSRLQLKSNQSKDKVLPKNNQVKAKKTQVEVHPRIPSVYNKKKSVTACKDSLNSITLNANAICATCNKCLVDSNHFVCVTKMLNNVHARTKKPNVVPISTKNPKSQANKSIATPNKKKVASKSTNQKPQSYFRIVQLILFIVNSGCTKHMTGNLKLLYNFVEKFMGTVCSGNDQFAPILGYGDLVQGNVMINRVYYVEGLNHNLFSVEIDELESKKAEFSDMYDVILHDCVSKDVMCSYLQSLSDLDALTELQLEKHSISLEIALQNCKEQVKNNTVCNEKASNVFRKEREQYFEIRDLKAQMQDKNIAISELKKLIENGKEKSVDTKFDRPSVVRQPNAQRIPKPSFL